MINPEVLEDARRLIGEYIRERREELDITPSQLADKCNMTVNTIHRIEEGKLWISLKQLLILTSALDMYFFLEAKEGEGQLAKVMRNRWIRPGDDN